MQPLPAQLEDLGLRLSGCFSPVPEDGLPALPDMAESQVWMVGMAGSRFWPSFSLSPEHQDGLPDALDRWSRRVGQRLAQQLGGVALFPFEGPPYWPFQRWARRCEPVQTSMLGLLMHPQFGLWHAFRFALLLPAEQRAEVTVQHISAGSEGLARACLSCSGQPCLQACPVLAFAPGRYDVARCVSYLRTEACGHCMGQGCAARRACPEGSAWRYEQDHAAFHMRAFRDAH
jgi:hypothetical protein